jgi:hypothetical protein
MPAVDEITQWGARVAPHGTCAYTDRERAESQVGTLTFAAAASEARAPLPRSGIGC